MKKRKTYSFATATARVWERYGVKWLKSLNPDEYYYLRNHERGVWQEEERDEGE